MLKKAALSLVLIFAVGASAAYAEDGKKKRPSKFDAGPIAWEVTCEVKNVKGGFTWTAIVREASEIPHVVVKCRAGGGHIAGVTPLFKPPKGNQPPVKKAPKK